MTYCVLLNGPRQVGKDHIADAYVGTNRTARKMPIIWPMKVAAMYELGFPEAYVHKLETDKDVAFDSLGGRTPREVYIEYGTRVREELGSSAIAEAWADRVRRFSIYSVIVVPDCRFREELDAATSLFGLTKTLLVRVRQDNYGWANDIGSYLSHSQAVDFDNTAQSPHVGQELRAIIEGRLV